MPPCITARGLSLNVLAGSQREIDGIMHAHVKPRLELKRKGGGALGPGGCCSKVAARKESAEDVTVPLFQLLALRFRRGGCSVWDIARNGLPNRRFTESPC